MPVDYQEGKIYKIYNTINDDIYIGSTTQKLCERMRKHRSNYKYKDKYKNLVNVKLYKSMEEHGVENFFIELIEKCPCNDKEELHKKEGEYIRGLKPSLNKVIAGRTHKEWREDNRETLLQDKKEWYEKNKEHQSEKMKKHREDNKEHIAIIKKEWYEKNKEHQSEKKKQYNEANKERIATHKAEKIKCECGCMVARGGLARHKRSANHKQLINYFN